MLIKMSAIIITSNRSCSTAFSHVNAVCDDKDEVNPPQNIRHCCGIRKQEGMTQNMPPESLAILTVFKPLV